MNTKGNQEIKRIRKELGITQGELAFPGMARSTIASWENGERIINHKQAARLSAHLENAFKYIVSPKVLMGQDKDISEVLKPIENVKITEDKLLELDNTILITSNDEAVEIILGIIDILKIDMDLNAKHILKYIIKLNEFKLTKEDYIQINLDLMMVYEILNDFNSVLIAASAIKIYINEFNNHDSLRYYFNLANAYYKLKKYTLAKECLKKAKKVATPKYKLNILSLESSILTMQKKFTEAIIINKKIITEAKILKLNNYIANSESNIAYMYTERKKINEAQKYIMDAMTYVKYIDNLNKLNVLDNKFYLDINTNSVTFDSFKKIILLTIELNNRNRRDDDIKFFINKCIENDKNVSTFLDILIFLKTHGITIRPELKLKIIQHIYKNHFNECDFTLFLDEIIKRY